MKRNRVAVSMGERKYEGPGRRGGIGGCGKDILYERAINLKK